jgi:hypothetical protein
LGQEFIIKSQKLEDKVNQLLPSQGGFQAGVDLSASTTVIPIVDLTETAEGSDVRADLQTAFSHGSMSAFNISNATTTVISTTGYFRVFGIANLFGSGYIAFNLTDGATTKLLANYIGLSSQYILNPFDFVVFMAAGDSMTIQSSSVDTRCTGATRQIADISGNLVNPI